MFRSAIFIYNSMITTINEFRKFYENNHPEGDFIKYDYNDTPDVEEIMNQAAQAMGEMTDSLFWMNTSEVEEIPFIIKDITGDTSYDFDKVDTYSTKQGAVKIYVTSDEGGYYIVCNTNMNGKKIVDDQIVDIYENDYSEVTPDDSNDFDFKGYGNGENGEDDVDPAGGTGLHSHESRKIVEGGSDGDFEHNQDQIVIASNLYDEGQVLFDQGNIEAAEQKRQEALKVGSWLSWTDTELPPYAKIQPKNESHENTVSGLANKLNVKLGDSIFALAMINSDGDKGWYVTYADSEEDAESKLKNIDNDSFENQYLGYSRKLNTSNDQFMNYDLEEYLTPNNQVTMTDYDITKWSKTFAQQRNEKIVNEGAVKRHWEEIMSAIEAGTELEYKSGENFGRAIPIEYRDNIVSFHNGIHVIDMYVKTSVNNLNDNFN